MSELQRYYCIWYWCYWYLKNIPVRYDLRQYQPYYTSTSMVWDLRQFQVQNCLLYTTSTNRYVPGFFSLPDARHKWALDLIWVQDWYESLLKLVPNTSKYLPGIKGGKKPHIRTSLVYICSKVHNRPTLKYTMNAVFSDPGLNFTLTTHQNTMKGEW